MRIQTIDSSHQPVVDCNGDLGIEVEDERLEELTEVLVDSSRTFTGKRFTGNLPRLDAKDSTDPLVFLRSQIAYLEAKAYEKQYEDYDKFEKWLGACISGEAGEGAESVDYETMDATGRADWVAADSDDIPMVDIQSGVVSKRIAHGAIGYSYFNQELRVAAMTGKPLVPRKQAAAVRAYKQKANNVALQGDTAKNFPGLFKDSAVTAYTRPSGAVWDAASATTILGDINYAINKINSDTDGNTYVTYLALDPASLGLMMQPVGSGGPNTVLLEWIMQKNLTTLMTGKKFNVVPGGKFLSTAATAGGSKRAVFFDPIDDNMVFHIPMPIKFAPPEVRLLKTIIPAEFRIGGLNKRRVLTVGFMDGL